MDILPESLQTFRHFSDFQIFINRNEGEWHMPFEWHVPHEIFYVISGRGKYYIENKVYFFEPGDLFVIGQDELHKSQLVDNETFEVMVIMFDPRVATIVQVDDGIDPLSLFYDRSEAFSHQLKVKSEDRKKLEWCFNLMLEEYNRKEGVSLRVVGSLLQWLLLELKKGYAQNNRFDSIESWNGMHLKPIVSNAMEYISNHFVEDINLDKISKKLNVNASYLSREFKRNTGFSVMEFITFKRIWLAREMLLYKDTQVAEIAYQVGYNNVTHFHWTFKKMIGVSPNKYRKLPRNYYNLKKH
jgi:AraC-like DNA-binding protein